MTIRGFIIALILLALAVWIGGFLAFTDRIETPAQLPPEADGIAVLTGSAGRIAAGLALIKQRPSARMLITGVGDGATRSALADLFPEDKTLFDCCIELDRDAQDTVGNAYQTALWVQRNNLQSIIIVTSISHMPRARLEMRRHMADIAIAAAPTGAGVDAPGSWRSNWSSLWRIGVEYNKYLLSLIHTRLFDDIGDVRS